MLIVARSRPEINLKDSVGDHEFNSVADTIGLSSLISH